MGVTRWLLKSQAWLRARDSWDCVRARVVRQLCIVLHGIPLYCNCIVMYCIVL